MSVSKTALGIQVMKDRSVRMSAQQRSALILCDGKRSADDVVRMTAAVGVTMNDIVVLSTLGLVDIGAALASVAVSAPTTPAQSASAPSGTAGEQGQPLVSSAQGNSETGADFATALNAAITLCSNLGFKGFGLNMALTSVDTFEKLQKMSPDIRRAAGEVKYKPLHALIFGQPL